MEGNDADLQDLSWRDGLAWVLIKGRPGSLREGDRGPPVGHLEVFAGEDLFSSRLTAQRTKPVAIPDMLSLSMRRAGWWPSRGNETSSVAARPMPGVRRLGAHINLDEPARLYAGGAELSLRCLAGASARMWGLFGVNSSLASASWLTESTIERVTSSCVPAGQEEGTPSSQLLSRRTRIRWRIALFTSTPKSSIESYKVLPLSCRWLSKRSDQLQN